MRTRDFTATATLLALAILGGTVGCFLPTPPIPVPPVPVPTVVPVPPVSYIERSMAETVLVGMTEAEVRGRLGTPLSITEESGEVTWMYALDEDRPDDPGARVRWEIHFRDTGGGLVVVSSFAF